MMTRSTTELGREAQRPGRLGDPARTLADDGRADPRLVAALAAFGMDGDQPPPPVSAGSTPEELLAFVQAAEEGFSAVFSALFSGLEPVAGVKREMTTIPGDEESAVILHLHRPVRSRDDDDRPLPCVVHFHG